MTEQTASDGSKTLYSYDDADRLGRIEWRSSSGTAQRKSEFRYDYASRRAVSAEFTWTAGAWVQQSETRRVFDGMDSVQERNALDEVTASYVRDGNIGGILSRTSAAGVSYFHYDGSGNVTALSDETGALVGRYSYDAFGNTLEVTGTRAQENPFRFSTKEVHGASGLYDYGYRFYSPGLGRWINRDPIRESGGLNIHGFVGNSPTNAVDEYGLDSQPKLPPNLIASQGVWTIKHHYGDGTNEHGKAHAHIYKNNRLVGKVDALGQPYDVAGTPWRDRGIRPFVDSHKKAINKSLKKCGRWLQNQVGPLQNMGPGRRYRGGGGPKPAKGRRWVGGRLRAGRLGGALGILGLGITGLDILLHPEDYDLSALYYNPETGYYENPLVGPVMKGPDPRYNRA